VKCHTGLGGKGEIVGVASKARLKRLGTEDGLVSRRLGTREGGAAKEHSVPALSQRRGMPVATRRGRSQT